MITYTNIKKKVISDAEYFATKAVSYSFAKANSTGIEKQFTITDKMRLGSLVDGLLTGGLVVNEEHYHLLETAKRIASLIKLKAPYLADCEKQVSFFADINYGELTMPTKGKLDYLLHGYSVIDLKITSESNINGLIEHFGYQNQLWHYAKLAQVNKAYIAIYSTKTKCFEIKGIDVSGDENEFWRQAIIIHGKSNQNGNN